MLTVLRTTWPLLLGILLLMVGNGMQGDRAAVVFSRPAEISAFIGGECP